MQKIADKETPEIILAKCNELTPSDLFKLVYVYKDNLSDFTVIPRKDHTILINRDMEQAEELAGIVTEFMKPGTTCRRRDKLFDRIEEIVGKKALDIILLERLRWLDALRLASRKKEAEEIIQDCKKKRILQKAKKEKELLEVIYNIGYGVYEEGYPCDEKRGAEYCFAYGYLKALQSIG